MATNDHDRRRLLASVETTMGTDSAGILMDHLPPSGWQNLATRSDLEALGDRLRLEFSEAMNRQTWRLVTAMLASQGVAAAVIGLLA